jgi:hypothetical protein
MVLLKTDFGRCEQVKTMPANRIGKGGRYRSTLHCSDGEIAVARPNRSDRTFPFHGVTRCPTKRNPHGQVRTVSFLDDAFHLHASSSIGSDRSPIVIRLLCILSDLQKNSQSVISNFHRRTVGLVVQ